MPSGTFPPPQHDNSHENIAAAKKELVQIVGANGISEVAAELKSRSSTEWSPSPVETTASLIVYPHTTEHVSNIMKICHRRSIPVTPFSGGTSLDGALAATRGGICIDFARMNKIIKLRKNDLDVTLQPAVGWQELNKVLEPEGLFFPVDPGPGAQIGGMIATGCSGTNAHRYGPMKDWVISTTLVLADGTIVKTRQRPRKSTAGYDLTRLIVGSGGTLGLVTEATLKLTALPQNVSVAVVAFPSMHKAVAAVTEMIQTGMSTEALELLDETAMRANNASGYLDREYKEVPTLFVKFANPSSEAVVKQVSAVRNLASRYSSVSFDASSDPESREALWAARKTVLWNLLALKRHPTDSFLSCDVAVPISHLALIIEETNDRIQASGLIGSCLGHVGDGNFHASVLYDESERTKAEEIISWCRRRGIELEGTVTGEHGVGLALRDLVTEELGVGATDMMRMIKLSLDPKCLLACDKIVRIEEGVEH
ncbi:hypothetical protein LTR62_006796 [Meristemomyces frigidus]|uniref:FAD-binding PCMH-type domain-containing protein n=1 Tax=Meristemomyces frigidus TaxID=1508187 RepID=A0AAN7YEA1_9PEZI|nr:hypothetical protein LTR62_006796 [Meristemomyces frigidus]